MFTIILIGIMALLVLIGTIKGITRGIGRQTVRTVTVILSAAIAFIATSVLASMFYEKFGGMTPEELVGIIESIGIQITGTDLEPILSNLSPETISYVIAIPLSLVILPVVFVLLFIVIKLIMLIVHVIFSAIFGLSKKKNTALTRTFGGILGAVQGLACAVIITMPIVGIATTASTVMTDLKENSENEAVVQIADDFNNTFSEYTDSGMVKFLGAVGGNVLYNQFTTATINGESYNIPEEVAEPMVQIVGASDKLHDFDWKNLSEDSKEGIFIIIDAVDDSKYFKKITLDVLELATDAYFDGALDLEADELLIEILDSAFSVIGSIDEESFATDLKTIFHTYAILGREGALTAFETGELEEVRTVLISDYEYVDGDPITSSNSNGGKVTVLKKVIEILNENEHTKPLITALSRISVSVLAQNFGTDLNVEEIYDTVKGGINQTLQISKEGKTEDEYKEEVKASIDSALQGVDIELEDNVLNEMANYVNDNYETLVDVTGGEITDEKVNEVILSYYDAFLNAGGSLDELPDELPGDLGDLDDLGGLIP